MAQNDRAKSYLGGNEVANCTPRCTRSFRHSSEANPSEATTTKLLIGLSVKSISRVRLFQGVFVSVCAEAHDDFIAHHIAKHIAMQHEARSAEHLVLCYAGLIFEVLPDVERQLFAVCQVSSFAFA
jgi:hypothetical protein